MLTKLKEKDIEELVEIQKQISSLIKKKQKEKKKELKQQFQAMAEEAGMSIDEVIQAKSATKKVKAKYRHGNKSWSGRGRRPRWIIELEEKGKNLADYLV
ncbi:MAG: histidine biosynthesis protein [Deltaproteobacteria bacterium]|nr:MAG: histidine biosynthesis protein [Deltaproteobacteria bacterium]